IGLGRLGGPWTWVWLSTARTPVSGGVFIGVGELAHRDGFSFGSQTWIRSAGFLVGRFSILDVRGIWFWFRFGGFSVGRQLVLVGVGRDCVSCARGCVSDIRVYG
ncbi:hypothetical protein R3P38DRAFT_3131493, partial [Favolaschia claudopus]